MSKTRLIAMIPLLLFVVIAVFFAKGLRLDPRHLPSMMVDKPVPDFTESTLEDANKQITNKDIKGQVALLNVWATWCTSCWAEHHVLMDVVEKEHVPIYGVNYKDERRTAQQWLQDRGNPYIENAFDDKGQLGIDLGVYGTPETFVIDKSGVIRYRLAGPMSPDTWQHVIKPLIEKLRAEV